jgi:hypothetical protein
VIAIGESGDWDRRVRWEIAGMVITEVLDGDSRNRTHGEGKVESKAMAEIEAMGITIAVIAAMAIAIGGCFSGTTTLQTRSSPSE